MHRGSVRDCYPLYRFAHARVTVTPVMLGYHRAMVTLTSLAQDPAALAALSHVEVLYTDLDGTLLAPGGGALADDSGTPSTVLAEAIVALNAAGLTVVPVSGREVGQLFELTRLLGWRDFIAEAGAIIVHGIRPDHEVRYIHGEWPSDLVAAGQPTPFDRIEASGAYELLTAAFPGRIEQYGPDESGRKATHLLRGCVDVREARVVISHLDPPLDIVDNGALRNRGTLECDGTTPHAFHLVARGVSKAAAIEADLAWRGLDRSQAAAIGDSGTDIQMADATALIALVANALEGEGVRAELDAAPRDNVFSLTRNRCEGWAEFAQLWLEARARA